MKVTVEVSRLARNYLVTFNSLFEMPLDSVFHCV